MLLKHATRLTAFPLFLTLENPFFDQRILLRSLLQCLVQLIRLHALLQLLSLTNDAGCDAGVWQDVTLNELTPLWSL
jgi:hypothetical protein